MINAGLLLWKVERRFWIANVLTALPFLVLGISSLSRIFVLSTLSTQAEVLHASEQNVWYIAGAILLSSVMQSGFCRLTIQDHGTGMSPETVARLFRIEDTLSTVGTAAEPGSGLGLILAQSLAERNGCQIGLDSRLGEGTAAHLWLPLAESR
ncbi:MAG: ATP-binding protein [Spirochaetota bacterium]